MKQGITKFAGIDVSDKHSEVVVVDASGEKLSQRKMATNRDGVCRLFENRPPMRILFESGTHSPWMSRQLESFGHEVLVVHAQQIHNLAKDRDKSDSADAEMMAWLACTTQLGKRTLRLVVHRDAERQSHLDVLRAREQLVSMRTALVNFCRMTVKTHGLRFAGCKAEAFARKCREVIPDECRLALEPIFDQLDALEKQIKTYDKKVKELCEKLYPETKMLRQVKGVGPITSLAFLLTIHDPARFTRNRRIGSFLGLRPGRFQSGESDPQLSITKQGNPFLRKLLLQSAQYILWLGSECDLQRWGRKLAERGGKAAKKKAAVAVARKLACLLHRLWVTGEVYDPDYLKRQLALAS